MKSLYWSVLLCLFVSTGCNRASSPETVSAQLGAVARASQGSVGLKVDNALVTYVIDDQPENASLQNGFFMQAESSGPALFVPILATESHTMPEVGDVVGLDLHTAPSPGTFTATIRKPNSPTVETTGLHSVKVLAEDALAFQLAFDFDSSEAPVESGNALVNRIVGGSLMVTSRLHPAGSGFLKAKVQLARNGFPENAYLLVSTALADVTHLQRGCQLRVEGVPVLKGDDGYFMLATRESELMLALCDPPTPTDNTLTTSAPSSIGAVIFSEFMTHSRENRGRHGEWLEVTNTTNLPLNLRGCELRRPKPAAPHIISEDVMVAPNGRIVISHSERPKGIVPDYVYYGDVLLLDERGRTRLALTCSSKVIDMVELAVRRISGRSLSLSPSKNDQKSNDVLKNWCWTPQTSAKATMNEDWATPRQPNLACPDA